MHQYHRILTAPCSVRQDLDRRLDRGTIGAACRDAGHSWRDCLLTPVAVIHWFTIRCSTGTPR